MTRFVVVKAVSPQVRMLRDGETYSQVDRGVSRDAEIERTWTSGIVAKPVNGGEVRETRRPAACETCKSLKTAI
jgi:hypothetical protein